MTMDTEALGVRPSMGTDSPSFHSGSTALCPEGYRGISGNGAKGPLGVVGGIGPVLHVLELVPIQGFGMAVDEG